MRAGCVDKGCGGSIYKTMRGVARAVAVRLSEEGCLVYSVGSSIESFIPSVHKHRGHCSQVEF